MGLKYPFLEDKRSNDDSTNLNPIFQAYCLAILHGERRARLDQDVEFWRERRLVAKNQNFLSYRFDTLSELVLSLVFEQYWYGAGAAHGNSGFRSFNYIISPVTEVSLDDFFASSKDYRPVVEAQLCESIRRTAWERGLGDLDQEWLAKGTKIEGNEVFTFSDRGLTFYFAPYQVAYYAAGSWQVTIPFYDLRDFLNPAGPHKFVIARET